MFTKHLLCAGRCTRSACCCLSSFLPLHNLTHAHTRMHTQTCPHGFMHTEHTATPRQAPSCAKCTHRGVHTHTHTHVDSQRCAHRHTESVSCTQHMPHMQTYTCTARLAPTHSLQEQQGEQGGLRATRGAWLIQWSRVRNRGVGRGDTWLPSGPPTGILEIPQDDLSGDRVWGHTGLFLRQEDGQCLREGSLSPLLRLSEGK